MTNTTKDGGGGVGQPLSNQHYKGTHAAVKSGGLMV